MKNIMAALVAILIMGCEVAVDSEADVEWLNAPGTEDMDMPFSSAVRVDKLLFVSGEIGYDRESGALVEGGIRPETRKTLENISQTLETFGSSMDKVVKCTVFLADISEWAAMNEVYKTFFPNKPARSALGVNGLALNARTEIECIAVVD
ncbi:MAG: Rid family detoxifying hydrolase [Gammaproteobacteria bacterium]|nr:Rid family detoxifying hydrolase [Gammaproteobacteria bacterium]MDH3372398.1 Rid family detoxifying hydrolase [Gammaproteobacteria bacterium]MDH3409033.1 Rid family detoxifying hydrolase [Gammaproteobacteria bacterium]MDH3551071.1 Rid family detoxifying hydrolase [Gammaproteobacteria bacterium]